MVRKTTHIQLIARRTATLYAVVILFGAVIVGRLFQLQVLQHDYYADLALAEHEAKFTIPSARGTIYARDGVGETPLVLNEVLPTVYVDPFGIDDDENQKLAEELHESLGVPVLDILEMLERNESRYQVVKKRVDLDTVNKLKEKDLNGVGFADESYRVYPQGQLGSQSLGFVNDEGVGQYGVEAFLDADLAGADGRYEAVTDVYGIPLSTSEQKVIEAPQDGKDITLTIDANVQRFVEQALEDGVKGSKGVSGSAIVMDPNTGAILAMANYPTYDPNEFGEVEDFSVFLNHVATSPYETGSGMKIMTMAAALNEGAVKFDDTYRDNGFVIVDDRRIENALPGSGIRTMTEVIKLSINTGVVHALQEIGGGEINEKARGTLYDYFTNRFGFGTPTGIGLANEGGGVVISPDDQEGNNVRYANMTFGQGMTVTLLQMAAATSALVNGGDYYQPYLIHSTTDSDGNTSVNEGKVIREDVVSQQTSNEIRAMMASVRADLVKREAGYEIGGKTGTAQVLDPETGEYSDDLEIGSFVGYGGAEKPEYVIMTRVDEPKIPGFAGTVAAAPIFADISEFMIDYYQIAPKQ